MCINKTEIVITFVSMLVLKHENKMRLVTI